MQLLDRRTVYRHINISLPPPQWAWMKRKEQPAASDLVRLALMAQRGGVYADATEFCLQPLDAWVHRMLRRSTGFIGSREWDASKNRLLEASNWMAAARPGHPVARAWLEYALEYWRAAVGPAVRGAVAGGRPLRVPLLLMDDLFADLARARGVARTPAARPSTQSALYFEAAAAPHVAGRSLETVRRFGAGASLAALRQADAPVDDAGRALPRRHRAPRPALAVAAALAHRTMPPTPPRAKRSTGRMWASCCSPAPPAGCRRRRSAAMLANAIDVESDVPGPPLCFGALHVPAAEVCVDSCNPVHCIGAAAAEAAWGE